MVFAVFFCQSSVLNDVFTVAIMRLKLPWCWKDSAVVAYGRVGVLLHTFFS